MWVVVGSHSLYLQNECKLNVQSIDISNKAIEACKLRGSHNASVQKYIRS
jgi:hypothetical protein